MTERSPRANGWVQPHCLPLSEATQAAIAQLQEVARQGGNVFEELMETVKVASLGQITDALFNVGGQYRRNM